MNILFSDELLQKYLSGKLNSLISVLNSYPESGLESLNIDTYSKKLASDQKLLKLHLDEEKSAFVKTIVTDEVRINNRAKKVPTYEIALYEMEFHGDPRLFKCDPGNISQRKPVGSIKDNKLTVHVTEYTIFSGNEALEKKIVKSFERYFEYVNDIAGKINSELDKYNANIEEYSKKYLTLKKEVYLQKEKSKINLTPFKKDKPAE